MKQTSLPRDIKQNDQEKFDTANNTQKNELNSSFAVPPSGNLRKSGPEISYLTDNTEETDNNYRRKELMMTEQEYEACRSPHIHQSFSVKRSFTFRNLEELMNQSNNSDENSPDQEELELMAVNCPDQEELMFRMD